VNGLKSRIITTTRIIDVAEHVGSSYNLKPLTHHNSKKLFNERIFGSKSDCPKQFSDVSHKIFKKCGVPLATLTTSSLMANKSRNIKVWCDLCESVGNVLANNYSIDSMRKILLLSYYDLTPYLKTCLLYLSIFLEDYTIRWDRLILRWIHYYKKDFARPSKIGLRGGQHFEPPRLMVGINRGGHFSLTEAVTKTA
jgi:disease resistance protein RPM1